MRDGLLTIAHRSGNFGGLKSGTKKNDEGKLIGWARVWNKSFPRSIDQEADFGEFDNSAINPLWKTKPKTMIEKVAEAKALKKAFNVHGVYIEEEMEREIALGKEAEEGEVVKNKKPKEKKAEEKPSEPASPLQLKTIESLAKRHKKKIDTKSLTKEKASELIKDLIGGKDERN